MQITDIDQSTIEGRLLRTAISYLKVTTHKDVDELLILAEINGLQSKLYKNDPIPQVPIEPYECTGTTNDEEALEGIVILGDRETYGNELHYHVYVPNFVEILSGKDIKKELEWIRESIKTTYQLCYPGRPVQVLFPSED